MEKNGHEKTLKDVIFKNSTIERLLNMYII